MARRLRAVMVMGDSPSPYNSVRMGPNRAAARWASSTYMGAPPQAMTRRLERSWPEATGSSTRRLIWVGARKGMRVTFQRVISSNTRAGMKPVES